MSLSAGSVVAGHRVEEVVARGGMGVVYRVTHVALQRERALKLIAPELAADERFRSRFRREWRVAAAIDHPHAIPIYDAGETDGLLYIVMQFVPGTDLRQMCRSGPLDPDLAAVIVDQVGGALDAAHARGLIHRDVKPANILVGTRAGEPHAFLTDFGLTKNLGSTVQLTDQGGWVGTVDYVAPEQIEGRAVDARTDIYGLGCVAYNALTGEVPFPRDNDVAKIWAHLKAPPPSLTERVPDLAEALDRVVARAMAKDPEERFPSAGDLGRAMVAAARGETYAGPERSVASGDASPTEADASPTEAEARTSAVPLSRRIRTYGREYRRVGSVTVLLSVILALAVVAVALMDGDSGSPVATQRPLVAYQSEVGQICDEVNEVNQAAPQRASAYRKRVHEATSLQALRDAIVDETVYSITVANNLSSRLAGLDAPSTKLRTSQRRAVASWKQNVRRAQAYRDRLKRIRSYRDLDRVVRQFDQRQRTVQERSNATTMEGLHRLGGPECEIEIPPSRKVIKLPKDPDAPRDSSGSGSGNQPVNPNSLPPDVGVQAPDSSVPAPDLNAPAPDTSAPTPDLAPPTYAAPERPPPDIGAPAQPDEPAPPADGSAN